MRRAKENLHRGKLVCYCQHRGEWAAETVLAHSTPSGSSHPARSTFRASKDPFFLLHKIQSLFVAFKTFGQSISVIYHINKRKVKNHMIISYFFFFFIMPLVFQLQFIFRVFPFFFDFRFLVLPVYLIATLYIIRV